jgi:4-hydroxy-tetrahydrodipicolinate synthase
MNSTRKPIQGVITALVTPFDTSGGIDFAAFRRLLDDQIEAGIHGVIPCGTTGESPTLSTEEKKSLITAAIERCKGTHTAVIAGTGSNSTPETVALSRWASDAGADGVLIVTPYYNKPSQAGLTQHFTQVADNVSCPVMLYNVPGRTGVSLAPDTIAKLASHPRIRFIKEATGNVALTSEIFDQLKEQGTSISVFSGDDATYLPLLAVGASGVVSVASNLFPRAMVALQAAFESGHATQAREIHDRFYPLFRDLFVESNPVPIKASLDWVAKSPSTSLCAASVRPPLCGLSAQSQSKLEASLKRCGLSRGGGTL